jgi:hypothetical protein
VIGITKAKQMPDGRPPEGVGVDQLLDAVPLRNQALREQRVGNTVTLWVKVRQNWITRGPLSWFMPFREERGIALDRIGTQVWRWCDGRATVEDVVERLASEHQLSFGEARMATLQFLQWLTQRNLVAVALPATNDDDAPPGSESGETHADDRLPAGTDFETA